MSLDNDIKLQKKKNTTFNSQTSLSSLSMKHSKKNGFQLKERNDLKPSISIIIKKPNKKYTSMKKRTNASLIKYSINLMSPSFQRLKTIVYTPQKNKSLINFMCMFNGKGNSKGISVKDNDKYYVPAKYASSSCYPILSYGANTYQGLIRTYNEDRISIYQNVKCPIELNNKWNDDLSVSFFGLFDGHGGHKCCDFLKANLHQYIFRDPSFPSDPIRALENGFNNTEKAFNHLNYGNNIVHDRSGSCALVCLIVNDMCYIANVGDSRCLYSYNLGLECFQVTRDHKPNDPIEKTRIELQGGSIYRNRLYSQMNVPWRILPGKLSVSRAFGDLEAKIPFFGGNPKVLISSPSITQFKINVLSDFLILGCDGIFDKLSNADIISMVWNSKYDFIKTKTIHEHCGIVTDAIMKYSLKKYTIDNISCIFICFSNYLDKIQDPSFTPVSTIKYIITQMKEIKDEGNSLNRHFFLLQPSYSPSSSFPFISTKGMMGKRFKLEQDN